MFILKRNDIKEFPFQDAANLNDSDLELWASEHNLTNFNTWMLPQLVALFGQFRVRKTDDGFHDSKALLADNMPKTDLWLVGIWRVINRLKRSSLVKSQIHPEYSRYSALVPLILSGLKQYQNISYSSWTEDGLSAIVDPKLYEAMMYDMPELSTERILQIREQGLMTKSGAKMGTLKPAKSTWKLTGIGNTELAEAPSLISTMVAQIWVAHPSIRNRYMILNPMDWDSMPEPLITVAVLEQSTNTKKEIVDLPW